MLWLQFFISNALPMGCNLLRTSATLEVLYGKPVSIVFYEETWGRLSLITIFLVVVVECHLRKTAATMKTWNGKEYNNTRFLRFEEHSEQKENFVVVIFPKTVTQSRTVIILRCMEIKLLRKRRGFHSYFRWRNALLHK